MKVLSPLLLVFALGLSGTENMFPNPGFESWSGRIPCHPAWRWGCEGKASFEKLEQSALFRHSGKASLHLKDSDPGRSNGVYTYFLSPGESRKLAGKILSFGVWCKQIRASGAKKIGIGLLCATEKKYTVVTDLIDDTDETAWTHLLVRLPIPEGANRIILRFFCANNFGQTGEAFFDDVVLTTGPLEKQQTEKNTEKNTVMEKKSRFLLPLYPAPSSWSWRPRGCFEFRTPAGKTPELELGIKKTSPKQGGQIICETVNGNRWYDFSKVPEGELKFTFLFTEDTPVRMELYSGGKRISHSLKKGIPEGNKFRYTFQIPERIPELRSVVLTFPHPKNAKTQWGDAGFYAGKESPAPVYAPAPDVDAFHAHYAKDAVFTSDRYTRPEIRNGTWYKRGRYEFLLGPWIYNRKDGWQPGKKYNPLNIDHLAYKEGPGKKVFDFMGFNAAQMSAAPNWFCMADYGLGVPADIREKERKFKVFAKEFDDIYFVADFAFSPDRNLESEFPEKRRKLDQRIDSWHSFVPLCPEAPEGDHFYTALMEGGTKLMLESGLNVGVYELFNESVYGCQCSYNTAAFSEAARKRHGSIEKANKLWGTCFASFDELGRCGDLRPYRGLWVEWWNFLAFRYGEVLKKYSSLIRKIDKRPNVYITEMLALNSIWNGFMDYRVIADSLDLLATEGGWKYGHAGLNRTGTNVDNGMETVVFGGTEHWYVCDFFSALTRGKKPVINNEHYCWRSEYGLRAPSKRSDMTTSLWNELMHGSSGNFTYVLDKRQFEYKTPEQARKNVIQISYKSSSLLNPYNWPPEELVGFKNFRDELEPFRDRVLPFPRVKAPSVAVYHSYVTHAMACIERNMNFKERMLRWYFAGLHRYYPMTFVFDREIAEGRIPEGVGAILIPCADFDDPSVVKGLDEFAKRGGVVIADRDAFRFDTYARKMSGSENFIRLDSRKEASSSGIARILLEKKILRHGVLEPADGGGKLTGADFQIIDRGDFKFLFLVNMSSLVHRKVLLKLNLQDAGNFYLSDPVKKRLIVSESGETWNASMLNTGVKLVLPPQERVLLVLDRKKPLNLAVFSVSKTDDEFRKTENVDSALMKEFNFRRAAERRRMSEARKMPSVHPERCRSLDLRKFMNMDIRDHAGGDHTGGGFDQGAKDFSNLPHGRIMAAGVPFTLVDPAHNNRKAMIVLAGKDRNYFPLEIGKIPLGGKAKKLYFLHTMGWGGAKGNPILTYRITYADNSVCEIPVHAREEIGPWTGRIGIEHATRAKIALESTTGEGEPLNIQCFRWENPHPEKTLERLDIRSACGSGVPAVFAITLEE